jgi:hypothetical protein
MSDEPRDPWAGVTAARLPASELTHLAAVRVQPGVRVHLVDKVAWVTWPGGLADVVACLLPAAGVEFFVRRGDEWFRFSSRVPTADRPPEGTGQPLDAVLVPERIVPGPPDETPLRKLAVRIVRGGGSRPATALRCTIGEILRWVEMATAVDLSKLAAARRGDHVLLRGADLPVIPGATRFWGTDVLLPLGFRPDPDLSPDVLRAVSGADPGDVVVFDESGVAVVPAAAFAPLTRAGVRLAAEAASGSPR